MIANYGYEDGTGTYYIKIDTLKCAQCDHKNCLEACPADVFHMEEDDWGDEIVAIEDKHRNNLMVLCLDCKSSGFSNGSYPCQKSCDMNSISHTW